MRRFTIEDFICLITFVFLVVFTLTCAVITAIGSV